MLLGWIDGQKIANRVDVDLMLNKKRPGEEVTITLFRGGKKMDLKVKLGERPQGN